MFSKKDRAAQPQDSGDSNDSGDSGDPIRAANKMRTDNLRVLGMLGRDYLKERKAKRRWGIFFKFLLAAWLGAALFLHYAEDALFSSPHTALVELSGIIGPNAESSDKINQSLRRAFAAKDAGGVVLRINSPGGSPVQAAQINAEIRRLKANYPAKPFYAVISDVCASGGYYVAVAADEIYGNRASLVGSIGVRLDGFGFVESMKKLGIERRLLTAGDNKAMLDPFLPEDAYQVNHARSVLDEVHRQFINAVKQGRGARLAAAGAADADLFSGLFWSGEQARRLGLIDEFGGLDDVAREVIGARRIVDYTVESSWLERLPVQLGALISRLLTQNMQNNFSLK